MDAFSIYEETTFIIAGVLHVVGIYHNHDPFFLILTGGRLTVTLLHTLVLAEHSAVSTETTLSSSSFSQFWATWF